MGAAVRLISLNTWKNEGRYADRVAVMAEGLKALVPDVIALQEAFVAPVLGADTAASLAKALGLRRAVAAMRPKLRAHAGQAGDAVPSRADLALLSRWPLGLCGARALAEHPADGERFALFADVLVPGPPASLPLRVGVVHLCHLPGAADLRAAQAAAALAFFRQGYDGPLVVLGDLNARFSDPELASWRAAPDLDQDLAGWALAADGPDRLACGAIDHVIGFGLSPHWRGQGRRLVLTEPGGPAAVMASDHVGVMVELLAC